MQHYAQVTEADMNEAAKIAVLNDAEKRVRLIANHTRWARLDSNQRPADYESEALTN